MFGPVISAQRGSGSARASPSPSGGAPRARSLGTKLLSPPGRAATEHRCQPPRTASIAPPPGTSARSTMVGRLRPGVLADAIASDMRQSSSDTQRTHALHSACCAAKSVNSFRLTARSASSNRPRASSSSAMAAVMPGVWKRR